MAEIVETERTKNLYEKLVEVGKEIDHLEKSRENTAQNYKFVPYKAYAHAARKKLYERGVLLTIDFPEVQFSRVQTAKGAELDVARVKARGIALDSRTGEAIERFAWGSGMDHGDKAVYKAETGAMKYLLRGLFLIPDEADDPEADEKLDRETAPEYVQQPQRLEKSQNGEERPKRRKAAKSENGDGKITDDQRRRLFAIARAAGVTDEQVKQAIREAGFESTADIPVAAYNSLLKAIAGDKLALA